MDTLTPSTRPRRPKDAHPAGTVKARPAATSAAVSGTGLGLVASTSSSTITGIGTSSAGGGAKTSGKGALRAVASESWDDDFLFQVSSTSSLALPLGASTSRPTTPASRSASASSSSTSTSPPSRHVHPSTPNRSWLLASESVESLSSAGWSDPDPTLTHAGFPASNQSTPRAKISTARRTVPSSPHADGWRSTTPSLSEADSSRSATADETEAESLEQQEYDARAHPSRLSFGDEADRERFAREDEQPSRPPSRASTGKSAKSWKAVLGFGNIGRRTGAREVITHPPGPSINQFVVLGRRSRANSGADQSREHLPQPPPRSATGLLRSTTLREPKSSSNLSSSTNRSSLQFAPRPPPVAPHSRSNPEPAVFAGARPGATISLDQWREYDSTSAEETGTEGEMSEFSEDEAHNRRRRAHVTPSTSFATTSAATWDPSASQASFASSASAFGLSPGRSEWDAPGAEQPAASRRRKLKKKRPAMAGAAETSEETESRSLSPSLNQPLLSSKASASSNGTSINTPSASIYTYRRGARGPSELHPPFAQDSGDEGKSRPRQRSATAGSAPSSTGTAHTDCDERGKVIEIDREWLGIVPFPPEAPAAASKLPLAARLTRKPSAPGKSHPPVTGRNQSGAKRPLSLSSMLSRSTSAIPLGARRAPSPVPLASPQPIPKSSSFTTRPSSAASVRPSLSQSTTAPPTTPVSKKMHRASSSVSDLTKPPKESPSFLARARAFSRTGNSAKPFPTPLPPPSPAKVPTMAPRPTLAARRSSREQMPPPVVRGALNTGWKMPSRPDSTVSDASNASNTSTLRPMSNVSTIGPLGGSLSRQSSIASRKEKGKSRPPPTRAQQQGHRPSISLSSTFDRPRSPFPLPPPVSRNPDVPRPRTAMAVDRPASYFFEEGMGGFEVVRRNSLSDLRIPSRITSSQARIEEDLERVKEFAKGIDDLKQLRQQYHQLIQIVVSPPSSADSDSDASFGGPSQAAMNKITQAIKRIEIDYQSWWEQAEALVDLGDGKPRKDSTKASPGVAASRRDRCVSLAQTSPTKRGTGSDTETEATRPVERSDNSRRTSAASSIDGGLTVEERQKQMLWGVLAPPTKGASLPSRGPPSPRPALGALDTSRPMPTKFPSATTPTTVASKPYPSLGVASLADPPRANGIRRVSKAGVSGIKEFLLRLKLKASEEHDLTPRGGLPNDPSPAAGRRSVSSPSRPKPATPSRSASTRGRSRSSSESDEDWDRPSTPDASPKAVTGLKRSRTQSTTVSGVNGERMALTTEAMPSLLLKVKEVHERCSECVTRLKGLTV